jgi:hypothetical protein
MKGHIRQRLAAARLSGLRPKGRRYPPGLGLGTIPAAREWLIVVGDSASECRCGRYWHIGWRALSRFRCFVRKGKNRMAIRAAIRVVLLGRGRVYACRRSVPPTAWHGLGPSDQRRPLP